MLKPVRKAALAVGILTLSLCAGCGERPEANRPAEEEIIEETPAPGTVNYGTMKELSETVGNLVAAGSFEELSSLFWEELPERPSAEDLRAAYKQLNAGSIVLKEGCPVLQEDACGGIAVLSGESGQYEAAFTASADLKLVSIAFAKRPEPAKAESSDRWQEYEITAGNAPAVSGILTMPGSREEPVIAVLMPEEVEDPMNESGSNAEFRKDLAHGLAERGIASVRFDMRCYEDPLLTTVFGISYERMISQDFAAIVHSLEQYPVNARKIVYIGHGPAGSLGYAAVMHHFEMDGGLVLLNSPYTEDGAHLLQRAAWLNESIALEALNMLAEPEAERTAVGGFPPAFWQAFQERNPLNYTRKVTIPILILQAEDDGITFFKKDYEDWKSQKGSNVTMKSYAGIGHDMIDKTGVFDPEIAKDIAAWINGEDINKKKTAGKKS